MFYLILPIHSDDGYAIDPFEYTHLSDALEDSIGSDWYEIAYEHPDNYLVTFLSSDTDGVLFGPITP